MNENQDSVEKLLILGPGQSKRNKPRMPCERLRNCSDNDGDMSKGHRSHLEWSGHWKNLEKF